METLIIVALILAGLLLFIVEVFLIPGISIAGVASAICLLYANYYAFSVLGTTAGFITLAASAIGCIAVMVWFMRSKTVDKLSLKKTLDYSTNPLKDLDIKVGDKGTSITRLALIGNAEINGHIIEVRSADGFIDEKTPVYVERIREGNVIVRKI
ncbi:MAG: NfeD family protein [Bacteroidales bacterium]|nr:NfeD family protein [Bacteroidales bacterium]